MGCELNRQNVIAVDLFDPPMAPTHLRKKIDGIIAVAKSKGVDEIGSVETAQAVLKGDWKRAKRLNTIAKREALETLTSRYAA